MLQILDKEKKISLLEMEDSYFITMQGVPLLIASLKELEETTMLLSLKVQHVPEENAITIALPKVIDYLFQAFPKVNRMYYDDTSLAPIILKKANFQKQEQHLYYINRPETLIQKNMRKK